MRHQKRGRKLNRSGSHRDAMLRNLVSSLFEHERVITTPAKAKEARPFAERLITMAKNGSLAKRRQAIRDLHDEHVVKHLFEEVAPRYAERPGGYCRILHMDQRRLGDGTDLCLLELVEEEIRRKGKRARPQIRVKATDPSALAPAATAEDTAAETASENAGQTEEAADTGAQPVADDSAAETSEEGEDKPE